MSDNNIVYLDLTGNTVYANTFDSGLFCSKDFGNNWTRPDTTKIPFSIITATATFESTIYVGSYRNAYRSSDGGDSWTNISQALVGKVTGFAKIGGVVYCSANSEGTTGGEIYSSNDEGNHWTHLWGDPGTVGINTIIAFENSLIAASSGHGVLISYDSGLSWKEVNDGLRNKNIYTINDLDSTLFAATLEGGFASTDKGMTWLDINNGLLSTQAFSLANIDNTLFAATGVISTSRDLGLTWATTTQIDQTGTGVNQIIAFDKSIFVSNREGKTFRSTDNGENWTLFAVGGAGVYLSLFDLQGKSLIAEAGDLFSTTDLGNTWEKLGSIAGNAYAFGSIGNNLVASTYSRTTYHSTDNGKNWTEVNIASKNIQVTCFARFGNRIFAGTFGEGIYYSLDSGATWLPNNYGLDGKVIQKLRVFNNSVFICCENGVFVSLDSGNRWISIDEGLINTDAYDIAAIGNELFVGLYGASVWHRPFTQLSVGDQPLRIENRPVASQNYPNPFNRTTIISFVLPSPGTVSLKIIDPLGKEAGSPLSEQNLCAGYHEIRWDANGLPDGVYYYHLMSGSLNETKKIVLIR
ncbi:MAG: T9SS type A sorting domain-containing protein [Bacteroidota bacterium]|nr:T9SS type A sorting domain-containing protein [Bacteroidota bacterium]MDP4230218.1 T9SS type A sorting domain-containing protein [Bacteroidota bacterium]MDP4235771.1 T9SS type A sorting domain-containing protein [Bacteroidota bacterium]